MRFPYGISPQSLGRWVAFERIAETQAKRGWEVGRSVMRRIIDLELEAIVRATAAREQREAEKLRHVRRLA